MLDVSAIETPVEVRVGPHLFRWEPPDLGYVLYAGDLDGDLAGEFSAESRKFTVGKPRVFLLVDMTKLGKVSKEARTQSAEGSKGLAMCGTAIVGAAGHIRIIAGLVSRAVELLQRKDAPTRFFTTEAEARHWINQRRQVLDAPSVSGSVRRR